MKFKHFRRLLEFFIIGIFFGIAEDLIAVKLATGAEFSWKIFWVVLLVAIPFAIISEVIIDMSEFKKVRWWWEKKEKTPRKKRKKSSINKK